MWEIKSCGVTVDLCKSHFDAVVVYEKCNGPDVQLYKYTDRGKVLVSSKRCNPPRYSSKSVPLALAVKKAA